MTKIFDNSKVISSLIIGLFIYLIGEFNNYLKLLILFNVIDYITGIAKGIINKNLNSKAMYYGGFKKALIYLVIIIANRIDNTFTGIFLRETTIIYYIIDEGISIFENIAPYISVPPQIGKYFKDIKKEQEGKGYSGHDNL